MNNGYAFTTKREISIRLSTDQSFVEECITLLYRLQTEDEREKCNTIHRNRRGFASSHAVNGSKLAVHLLEGALWDDEERAMASEMISHYTKQIARYLRDEQMNSTPELKEQQAHFFTPQG